MLTHSQLNRSRKDYCIFLILVFLLPLTFTSAFAQIDVSGQVTDANDEGLPGVNILVKGSTSGTLSDADGNYNIRVPEGSDVLVFTSIGYTSQEVPINGRSTINMTMEEDVQELEELVVIGYGTEKAANITGAIARVDLEDSPLGLMPNTNILQSLRGGVAGVNVGTQNSPGETPSFLVRGQNSINGSNSPLIVLDGIIYLGDIGDINPADIASIDVLKDASAAAAYGSRSANGVIMINTKRGKTSTPTIRFSTSVGLNTWPNKMDLMETPRYLEKYAVQNNYANVDDIVWDDQTRNVLFDQRVNTDWLDLVSRNGMLQDYQASVSGTAEKVNYFFSGGYSSQEGVILGDNFERISLRTRLTFEATPWLEVGIDGTYNNNDFSGIGANLGAAMTMAPIGYPYRYENMPYDVDANTSTALERYPTGSSIQSPLWGTDGTVEDVDTDNFFRFAGYALFKVPKIEGLTYRLNYSTYANFITQDRFFSENYYIQEQLEEPFFNRYSPSSIQNNLTQANGYNINQQDYNYVVDNIINYNRDFGAHYLDVTLVATRDFTSQKIETLNGSDFSTNGNTTLGVNGLPFAQVQVNSLSIIERANIGYLARLGYTFNDKYHLNASFRRDGASVFGEEKKWGNFPSIGVAWTATEESFMQGSDLLSYLKVKASYGVNGNQGVNPYGTLAPVRSGESGGIPYEFGDAPATLLWGIQQSSLANPNLGWERTTSFNSGIQSAWLNNRMRLDVDFYFSKTRDQIFSRQIPIMTGFASIISSLGQVDNNGVEINLSYDVLQRNDLNWNTNLTFWRNRNIVAELYGDDIDGDGREEDDIANNLFIGESLGAIFGYEYMGVVQESDTEYLGNNGGQPGDPMFRDLDGDGVITAEDRKILGFGQENFRLGLTNTLNYKNLSLYVLVSGIFGGNGFYQQANPLYNSFRTRFDTNEIDHDWWTPENQSEEFLRPAYTGGRYLGLQSRTFVRIQDVTLSYTLPSSALSALNISSLKVYSTINNLATFTNWFGGGDPEEGIPALSGIYPVPTVYSFGLNVSF
jgi:TonB-linked SusC/RagA family outer membrane protein